jgi:hypothetical protein
MAYLFFTDAYDSLIGIEGILKRSQREHGQPALYFQPEAWLRSFLIQLHQSWMDEPFDEERDLVRDPHHRYAYGVDEDTLMNAGFSIVHDEDGVLYRVLLEEPVIESALRVLSLCTKFSEPVDVSHYEVMHDLIFKEVGFRAKDERLVRCLGFSQAWLDENSEHLLEECKEIWPGEQKHHYDTQYKTPVSHRVNLIVARGGSNALPQVEYSRSNIRVVSHNQDVDDMCSTATVELTSSCVVEGYATRLADFDPSEWSGTVQMAVSAAEAHVFPSEPFAKVATKLEQSGPCEVTLTGVVVEATCVENPWTGGSFWSLLLKHGSNVPRDQYVQVLTPILNRYGSVVPQSGHICQATGVLSMTGFMP